MRLSEAISSGGVAHVRPDGEVFAGTRSHAATPQRSRRSIAPDRGAKVLVGARSSEVRDHRHQFAIARRGKMGRQASGVSFLTAIGGGELLTAGRLPTNTENSPAEQWQ